MFEEHPKDFLAHAKSRGPNLEGMIKKGLLEVIYLRPLDLSVDEALLEIQAAVERTKAQRLVIDSLSGFELALAPTFREDFRESLYRMVGALTGAGVTVFMTTEVAQTFTDLRFSTDLISFLTDDIIVQRYVEIEGEVRKVMTVIKMRGSEHSKALRLYDVTKSGLVVGPTLRDYRGIITGVAQRYQRTEAGTENSSRGPEWEGAFFSPVTLAGWGGGVLVAFCPRGGGGRLLGGGGGGWAGPGRGGGHRAVAGGGGGGGVGGHRGRLEKGGKPPVLRGKKPPTGPRWLPPRARWWGFFFGALGTADPPAARWSARSVAAISGSAAACANRSVKPGRAGEHRRGQRQPVVDDVDGLEVGRLVFLEVAVVAQRQALEHHQQ